MYIVSLQFHSNYIFYGKQRSFLSIIIIFRIFSEVNFIFRNDRIGMNFATMRDTSEPSKAASLQSDFNTLAFLDIETTDLGEKADIWQLCIAAVAVNDFLGEVPLGKVKSFIRFYNPPSEFHPDASSLTGMDNKKLKDYPSIDDKAREEFQHFLEQLDVPICFIAHYGIKFDFPLLKRDFGDSFPSAIKFVDSIDLFRFHQSMFIPKGIISYRLKDVHKRYFKNEPITQHEASQDVETLIKCLLYIKDCPRMKSYNEHFMKCVSKYCTSFDSIGKIPQKLK